MTCANCGTDNREGRKFCSECGTSLASGCPSCGAANEPGEKFCGECGATLASASTGVPPAAAPAAERRLVSVLFADLVGFTTLSESRDPEEVRELLSRYFDTCRRLIELYGGTVEKFIGDAVMAVWGTPTATEDDAERAVRAALDLVAAVSALGDEIGAPELAARAGVLTGEAAVTIGAEGQGMVAGDLVNTAARIQSAANPGSVLVGDSTRRASELTVVYEDAGTHELKGKEEAAQLFRALRVASGRRGALKSTGLEPPFVGRDRELRLVKELFHASAEERTAHLVSAMGIAGIGKSRLAWEFYKYFDGLVDNVYWHRGRCLAYGEGVTYWALADMVRMRARISEDDDDATARSKLDATLTEHMLDRDERAFVEPMLASLLGIAEEQSSHERHDLFAAWRLFFERLANTYPTVLVFEDMQWADASLLEFVEYLLEWSKSSPLFVLVLTRPELLDKRPSWGAGHRNFTSLHLGPLSESAMTELLDGFVPGLPERAADADPGSRRRRASLRSRDGAHAARPRIARSGRLDLPPDRRDPVARSARDAARARRLASRRAPRGGASPTPGRRRTRQDLHAPGTRRGRRSRRKPSSIRCSRHSRARRSSACRPIPRRPSTASTASSRTSCATSPTRRSRRRSVARATSPRPRTSKGRSPTKTRSPRSSPRTSSTPTRHSPTRTTQPRSRRKHRRRSCERATAHSRSEQRARHCVTSNGRPSSQTVHRSGPISSIAPVGSGATRPSGPTAERLLGEAIALHEAEGDLRSAARVSGRLASIEAGQGRMEDSVAARRGGVRERSRRTSRVRSSP